MTICTRKIWMLIIILVALAAGGCSQQFPADEDWEGELHLLLRVTTGETGGNGTRALADGDYFESPVIKPEKLNTLRVIIVDISAGSPNEGRIIHNHMEAISNPSDKFTLLQTFKVDFSTTYRIYLIANEGGFTGLGEMLTDDLARGKMYEAGKLENHVISASSAGQPVIDNSTGTAQLSVPMSEVYEITTREKPTGYKETNKFYETKNFFLTRAASKFSFYFFRKDNNVLTDNGMQIKGIKITGLGHKEYILPNNTVYKPAKNIAGEENDNAEREITSFHLPGGDNGIGEYTFIVPESKPLRFVDFPVKTSDAVSGKEFGPAIYFPESKGDVSKGDGTEGEFMCSISFDGEVYEPAVKLPNLTSLPRNTHVKVNVTVNGSKLEMEVTLVPYKGVTLRPGFGI